MQIDIAVIGGGPAGLAAAEAAAARLDGRARIVVFEAKPSVGRKFLMAGKSGLNITNAEPFDRFVDRYASGSAALRTALEAFGPTTLRAWMAELGQESFVGSSGRVFPKAMKASPLLRAWIARLAAAGVEIRTRWRWTGGPAGALRFETPGGDRRVAARAVVLALGGASWPRLGSDGAWTKPLNALGGALEPFEPSNIGWEVAWSAHFRDRFAGAPLKSVALQVGARRFKGDLMVTRYGVEGGPIYTATPALLRGAAAAVDLAPDRNVEAVAAALARPRGGASFSNWMRKTARLSPIKATLLRETDVPAEPGALARLIKGVPLALCGPRPLEEGISTAGGVAWRSVTHALELARQPGVFVAGEMLAWDAPTGGYLLTACLALGRKAGKDAAARIIRASAE